MKVFLVTSGEYSDYSVDAVYTTRKQAEVVAHHMGTEGRVEEFELDPATAVPDDSILRPYSVLMSNDGDGKAWTSSRAINDLCGAPGWHVYEPMGRQNIDGSGVVEIEVRVMARHEEHAIKIANEVRGQVVAQGFWQVGSHNRRGEWVHGSQ